MEIERKYGATAIVTFPLVRKGDSNFTLSASTAAGDIMLVKDEATAVTAANLATLISGSNGLYQLTLSDTEMQAARVGVTVVDATATKVWEDQAILISTYGNASAQHLFDRGSAQVVVSTINDKTGYEVNSVTTAGVSDIMTRDAMTESYAVDGAAFTPAQGLYEINQRLSDFSSSATAISVHKRDGTTEAYKLSLNSTASPTSVTRVS